MAVQMNARKTIRILGISFVVVALLVFSTAVVTDFDCHNAADDARCPYCHLNHQGPAEREITHAVSVQPVTYLALPTDSGPAFIPVSFETSPRAPPF